VAVASAGPYASLHFAPDRQPHQHPTTLFLEAGCPSCRPTNSVKALKANQPAGDVSHKPGGRLPLLSARPAVTPATLKRAAVMCTDL